MKTLSPALQAHLDSGATTLAWCWRIERADGVVFGFTDHDRRWRSAASRTSPSPDSRRRRSGAAPISRSTHRTPRAC